MSLSMKKVASALSFAHLAGLGRGKAAASAEEEEDKKKDEGAKAKADDDEPEKKDDDEDKKPDAKAEDDDPNAESDDPEKKDDDEKKAKKAKAEDSDEDDDDEKMRAGAMKERARWAAVFSSPAVARNVAAAAELAATTDMSSDKILAMVAKLSPAGAQHPGRAAQNPRHAASGGTAPPSAQQATAARWDEHLKAASKAGRR